MTISELIQAGGVVLSFTVLIYQIAVLVRDGREGPPELRIIGRTLDSIQTEQVQLLRKILAKI